MNSTPHYDLGTPCWREIWVDPVSGDDSADGTVRDCALRTIQAAWNRVPERTAPGDEGFRIQLCPGAYAVDADGHLNLNGRYACAAAPILFQPADGAQSVKLPPIDMDHCSYVYLQDLTFLSPTLPIQSSYDNVIHFADCDHILLRRVVGVGEDAPALPRIVLKANQCTHLYIEDCEFSGATAYVFAYVAVFYGHIVRSRFRRSNFAGLCVKGGSAYHLIAANEVDDCRIVGIEAGEGTGFPYLVPPWLHYEAYEIKMVNNVVRDCGSGCCVGGGYNIVIAFNTCVRVGSNRDAMLVTLGAHVWVKEAAEVCERYYKLGGWCPPDGETFIPNRNIQICNNVVFNPDGFESKFAHFGISGPMPSKPLSNVPDPIGVTEIRIEGNVIWNGGPDKPVLDDVENEWGLAAKSILKVEDLRPVNHFNTLRPEFRGAEQGDFRPLPGGKLSAVKPVSLLPFSSDDPRRPPVPAGDPDNSVPTDKEGKDRSAGTIGAFA